MAVAQRRLATFTQEVAARQSETAARAAAREARAAESARLARAAKADARRSELERDRAVARDRAAAFAAKRAAADADVNRRAAQSTESFCLLLNDFSPKSLETNTRERKSCRQNNNKTHQPPPDRRMIDLGCLKPRS